MKNKTTSITDFSQLVKELNESGIKNNVAVVWAEDSHTIDAVEMAYKAGVINPAEKDKDEDILKTHQKKQ